MTIKLTGISSRIDECAGLIIQKARINYQKLNYNDKGWIDPEDVLQEGLMAACEAESTFQQFKKKKPAIGPVPTNKFSTYLYTGLDFKYRRFREFLGTKKRSTWQAIFFDIDSLLKEDGTTTLGATLAVNEAPADTGLMAVESFLEVCQCVSTRAFGILVAGVLLGDRKTDGKLFPAVVQEIRNACQKVGLGYGEMEFLIKNEVARSFILAKLAGMYNMEKDVQANVERSKLKLLTCRECLGSFGLDAVAKGQYFVSTFTCKTCYDYMAEMPSSVTCFGKKKISGKGGQEGYSAEDIECQIHCADRKLCQRYVNQKEEEQMPNKKAKSAPVVDVEDEIDDIQVDDLDDEDGDVGELPVKKSKTSIALGKKATAAPVAEEEEPEEDAEEEEEDSEEPEEEFEDDVDDEPEEDESEEEEEPEDDDEELAKGVAEEEEEPEEEEAEPEPVKPAKKKQVAKAAPVKAAKKVVKKAAAPAKAPVKAAKTAATKKVVKKAAAPVKTIKKAAAPVKSTKKVAKTVKKAPAKVATKSAKGAKGTKVVASGKGKKAVAKKVHKEPELQDLYPPPAEVGGRWPHKRGSVARYCFQKALKGVKAADLQAEVEKFGRSWPIMLKVMTDGYTGKIRTTHRWTLRNEKGGRIRIVDVKPLHLEMTAKKAEKKA